MPRVSQTRKENAPTCLSETQPEQVFRHGQDYLRSDLTAELLRKSPAARSTLKQTRIH